jgi:hypothetical protein
MIFVSNLFLSVLIILQVYAESFSENGNSETGNGKFHFAQKEPSFSNLLGLAYCIFKKKQSISVVTFTKTTFNTACEFVFFMVQ